MSERGYRLGAPHGLMGKRTAEALRRYQKERGLAPTGRFGEATKAALQTVPSAELPRTETSAGRAKRRRGNRLPAKYRR